MRWRTVPAVVLPLTAAILVALLVGSTWWGRIRYPYDLEWMEGGMLAHAWRVQHGLPLYGPPSAEFVPFIYPPGYSWVLALLGEPFGLGPTLGRLISVTGTVAALASLGFAVRWRGGSTVVALATAAVFLGTYPDGGCFFDLVRPDGLCLGLLGWSIALALRPDRRATVASGLLLALAFLVKQNVAAFGLPLLLAIGWRDGWRAGSAFALASAGPALLAVGALEWSTGGWFLRYLVDVPSSQPVAADGVLLASPREWGNPLPVALGVITAAVLWVAADAPSPVPKPLRAMLPVVVGMVVATFGTYGPPPPETGQLNVPSGVAFFAVGAIPVALVLRSVGWAAERRWPSWSAGFAIGVGAVGLGFAAWMRGHLGGFLNVHLPAFYVLALGFGWVCTWATARWPTAGMRSAVGVALAVQLAWSLVRYDRGSLVPHPADYAAGYRVVTALEKIDGPVLSPYAAWLPVYAGKEPSLHAQGLWDLDLSDRYRERTAVVAEALRAHRWGAVLLGNQAFPFPVQESYGAPQTLVEPRSRVLFPKSGFTARPEKLLLPR